MVYRRPLFQTVVERLREPRRFIQVLAGPRQTGKTTLARQVLDVVDGVSHYASADAPTLEDRAWIEAQWNLARTRLRQSGSSAGVLVLDEVQKVPTWSEIVKRLWDEDTAGGVALHVLLLGSAPLLVQRGLSESLAGRFEVVRVPHWSLTEMQAAFGWDVEQFVFFGGYPGAAPLVDDEQRWAAYIRDSLIETTLSRDVLLLTRVDKPALLRQVFRLACDYSGQVLSYQKMLGQLQDAGNTTTLAHYLELLAAAGLVGGLQKYSGSRVRQRGSSPKLVVHNTALVSASLGLPREMVHARRDLWGRLVETAVGAHLVNTADAEMRVAYWRERGREVDYVLSGKGELVGVEVKSGRPRDVRSGFHAFRSSYQLARLLVVGPGGVALEEFLSRPAGSWLI
jgi:uncharacterized protein